MSADPAVSGIAGKGAGAYASRRRKSKAGDRPGWVTYAIMGTVIALSAYPLYYSFLLGSSDAITIAKDPIPSLIPQGNFIDNVSRVINSDIKFWQALFNSVLVAAITAASVVLFATLAGFAFSKLKFRGRGPLLVFVVATMAIPAQLSVVPLFILMAELGWTGRLEAVIVPGMVTAFGVFWMTQYLESALPYELIEAARVDGCSMIRTFWHITMPAARPAASMLGLFTLSAHGQHSSGHSSCLVRRIPHCQWLFSCYRPRILRITHSSSRESRLPQPHCWCFSSSLDVNWWPGSWLVL